MPRDDDHKPVHRRHFFRAALGELLKPLERKAAPLQRAIQEFGALHAPKPEPRRVPLPVWLRPPGALAEEEFRDTCSRCGECVQVCPAHCIKIEPGGRGDGMPFIAVEEMPCVMCDGLLCMGACPTGALVRTPRAEIYMGTAEFHPDRCLRATYQECTICVDSCPVGPAALELRNGTVHVIEDGCTGCGVCEHHCPTFPKSITVTPKAGRN